MIDDLALAIADLQFARSSHLQWAEHLEAHAASGQPCPQCDERPYKLDAAHEREWVAKYDRVLRLLSPSEAPKPAGWHNGELYCYGGCGTRYADFPRDLSLPTSLWNRIAVGHPFDETQDDIEREGRGGVLCPFCIIRRLAALPGCTVIFADIDRPPIQET